MSYHGQKPAVQEVHEAKQPLNGIMKRLQHQYNTDKTLSKAKQEAILKAAKHLQNAEEELTLAREALEF